MKSETMDIKFDNKQRLQRIKDAKTKIFDLIIIGGGITGAGIALDAALRGLSTLLVEKKDFAAGTSSKSTKLIHGGLRYLKQLEFGLVKETGLERAVAHQNIPHLVHPEKMLLPIVQKGTFNKFSAMLAISFYDLLAKVPANDRRQSYNKRKTLNLEPLLNPSILKSSIQYSEYRTDDARLTIELIKASRREGADAFNYMEVQDFIYTENQVSGVKCIDGTTGEHYVFKGNQVVSAAGPWVDKLRVLDKSKNGKSLQLTKGVHIVLPKEKLPLNSSVYFDAFDGRMLFAIPRGKVTYVGTSDTNYEGNLDKIVCTTKDANYIIDAVNHMFEVNNLTISDITSTWAGLRPLIHEDGKSPSELSRKDEIFISNTKLISIAGGKLTGYRKMAERIVDLVIKNNKTLPKVKCMTKNYKIHADSLVDYNAYEEYTKTLLSEDHKFTMTPYKAWYLATNYGKNATEIIKMANSKSTVRSEALLAAEIEYCLRYESCYEPDDFFNRRSGRLYFDIESIYQNIDFIVKEFSNHFEWNPKTEEKMKAKSIKFIKEVSQIED